MHENRLAQGEGFFYRGPRQGCVLWTLGTLQLKLLPANALLLIFSLESRKKYVLNLKNGPGLQSSSG